MAQEYIKILLVDDEEEFVNTLAERINMRLFNADIALNGETALKMIDNDIPDIMVLDLRMPGIDGIEVLKKVKHMYPEVQVIILTGHGSKQDKDAAISLGAFDYLQKPVEIDSLVKKIRQAYKKRKASYAVSGTL